MCKKHPKYQGKRKPRANCADCWKLYESSPARVFSRKQENLHIKKEKTQLRKEAKVAVEKVEELEKELEAILTMKDNLYTFKIKPSESSKSEATAIWLASDWHVGEKVTFGQTNGINQYNPTISKARGEQYFVNALRLTKIFSQDVEIKNVVLALLGDLITGHLHLDAVETNYMAPVEEAIYAQNIIASGIRYVLENSELNIVVPCASGN